QCRRLRRRRHPLDPRGDGEAGSGQVAGRTLLGDTDRRALRLLEPGAATQPPRPGRSNLAAAALPHLLGPSRRRRRAQQAVLRRGRPAQGTLEDRRRPPHGRPRDSPAGIRAPRRRLLRRRPSGPAPSGQMIGRCRPRSCFRIEVVTERRPTFRVVAAAPSPLGVGRTAALAGLLLGAACVLALSVAGLPSRVGTPPSSHAVSGAVGLVVVAIVSMGFVVSLGMMASARARARRARHRVPGVRLPLLQRPLLVALLAAVIAAPLLMVVLPYRGAHTRQAPALTRTQTAQRRTPPAPVVPERFHWPTLAAAAAGAALALVAIALVVRSEIGRSSPPSEEPQIDEAVSAGIDALEAEADPRRGVIRAYAAMERTLGERGFARRAAETPLEYLTRLLARVEAGASAATRLTSLYERAKFSSHEIDESMGQNAVAALHDLRAEGN